MCHYSSRDLKGKYIKLLALYIHAICVPEPFTFTAFLANKRMLSCEIHLSTHKDRTTQLT